MNKKIISFFVILSIIFSLYNTTFAEDLYEEYKKNVETNCLNAPFYTEEDNWNKFIYIYKKYQKYYPSVEELKNDSKVKYLLNKWTKDTFWLLAIKEIYRDTQNEIYKCWIISAQYRWYKLIEQNIKLDKTWTVKNLVKSKLKPKIRRLKATHKQCKFDDKLTISKKQILDQSTFELCKYSYYLDYLNDYYIDIEKILWIDKVKNNKKITNQLSYDPKYIESIINNNNAKINEEKEHSFKIYEIAFTAYSEYQSNFPIHIALELLKDNLIIFREKLYKTLSPISQVIYKFINAMSK